MVYGWFILDFVNTTYSIYETHATHWMRSFAPHMYVLVFLTSHCLQKKSYLFSLSPDASCVVLTLYAHINFF